MERRLSTHETAPSLDGVLANEPVVQKAVMVAQKAHEGQFRADGAPYFSHLEAVARIICDEWGIENPEILAAAFLHDTTEDTKMTQEQIYREFGAEIGSLVDSVSQFRSQTPKTKEEIDKETLKKVAGKNFLDPRVGVLKLGDRLHNMRTLAHIPNEKKRIAKAKETLNVYAPLAESLGIWVVKRELENLALQYTDPKNYMLYSQLFEDDKRTKEPFIAYMTSYLSTVLGMEGINCEISHRKNSYARIKDKAKTQLFSMIDDVISFRVVINEDDEKKATEECLKTLGILWEKFGSFEDKKRFDNYFTDPRNNGYSAFQITLNLPEGAVKIAITSKKKEEYNNWGIVSILKTGNADLKKYVLKLIFTPTGEVKFFQPTANGYDFAYHINARLGAQASGMMIDGARHDLSTVIPNGATVEILPGEDRLVPDDVARLHSLPQTKKIVEQQFTELEMFEQQKRGREIVTRIISSRGLLNLYDLLRLKEHTPKVMNILYKLGSKGSLSRLYQAIGSGVVNEDELKSELDKNGITKENLGLTSILIDGADSAGVLEFFTGKINALGGNIRRNYGESNQGHYIQHFVVENLSSESEEKLRLTLAGNQFKNVVIV